MGIFKGTTKKDVVKGAAKFSVGTAAYSGITHAVSETVSSVAGDLTGEIVGGIVEEFIPFIGSLSEVHLYTTQNLENDKGCDLVEQGKYEEAIQCFDKSLER